MAETWTIPCVEHVPDAEELEQLFQDLANNKLPTLQWKSPERRAPNVPKDTPEQLTTPAVHSESTPAKNDSYDFFDESPTDVRIRKPVTPKSSTKKKTANFENVLDSFKKQQVRVQLPKDTTGGNSGSM